MHRKIFCCEIKANKQLKYESERKREKGVRIIVV